jgi:hypothetical protein
MDNGTSCSHSCHLCDCLHLTRVSFSLHPISSSLSTNSRLASLKKGDTILLHSAAGGVGMAAVSYLLLVTTKLEMTMYRYGTVNSLVQKFSPLLEVQRKENC